jgi:hypothetical protein
MLQTLANIIVVDLMMPVAIIGSLTALAIMYWHWQNELIEALRLRRTVRLKS